MTTENTESDVPNTSIFPGNAFFSSALLDPDLEVPNGIVDPQGNEAPKRFSVYRNNVVTSLMEAMGQTYPAILEIVGEDNFATLSRIYISQFPPRTAVMASYGDHFPQFLQGFEPLSHSPFLVDVARLEKAWLEAYHAADDPVLESDTLGSVEPDALMQTRFKTHAATQLITSDFALYNLFGYRECHPDSNLDMKSPQSVLITRPTLAVETHCIDPANSAFFSILIENNTLQSAIETAMEVDENFDATPAIGLLLTSGAFSSLETPDN